MAFDINTAKAVESPSGGFDISSAKPATQAEEKDTKNTDWYKRNFPSIVSDKGLGNDLLEGAKGAGAGVLDIVSGLAKIPVQVGAAALGKLARPSMSLDELYSAAGQSIEGYAPSFGNPENPAYHAMMYPFEKLGQAQEWLGNTAGELTGSKDVAGAVKMGSNFLPIPVARVAKTVKKAIPESRPKVAPTKDFDAILNRESEVLVDDPATAEWKARAEDMQRNDQTVNRLEAAIAKQNPKQPTIALPDQRGGGAPIIVSPDGTAIRPQDTPWRDRVVEQQRVANEEVKGRNNAEQETLLEQAIQENAQRAIAEREAAQAFEVNRQGTLDRNAADRARQEQAPIPGLAESRLREIEDSIARTQELNTRGQQMAITEDFGNNDPMARMPNMRVDENGMPIRADLFIEAQNLQDPLQRHLWGDELPVRTGDHGVPMTQAMDRMPAGPDRELAVSQLSGVPVKDLPGKVSSILEDGPSGLSRTQRGAIDTKAIAEGLTRLRTGLRFSNKPIAGALHIQPTNKPDTLSTPRTPETIARKAELAAKAKLVNLENTPYDRVTTLEEAVSTIDPKNDMWRTGATNLRSGAEAAVRTNVKNKQVNFVRTILQEARNQAETMSKRYLTDNKTGIIRMVKDLSEQERVDMAHALMALDRNQRALTPEVMDSFGFTEKQKAAALRIREALDERYASANKALGEQGYAAFFHREGYMPSMFSGAYVSFVGMLDKDGKFITKGIAQADTKFGHDAAVAKYKEMGPEYSVVITSPRRGLNTKVGHNKTYNGFTDLVARIAEIDPRFAEAKAIVDQHMADQVASLYRFDVHEIKKAGVRGSLGDRPWLSRKENAKQFYEGLVDYLEEGFRYDSLQAPLNDIGKLLTDPNMQSKMPNTVKFIQKHVDKITGQNLNVFGAAGNAIIDKAFSLVGTGSKAPKAVVNAATSVSTTSMMGMFNMGFAGMQLSQIVTGGMPEAAAIRNTLGLSHESMVGSFTTAGVYHMAKMSIGVMDGVPAHLQEAFKWAHEKGMFDYSEAELLHNLNKSDARVRAEGFVNSTIVVPEKLTRPPVFMSFVDMFHKAGYVGEDGMLRAQAATDYAMTHYHPDERPGIYSALGQMGSMMGALSTYKHNFIEQGVSRVINGKQNKEALLVAMAIGAGLYGVSGLPGYQEVNSAVEATTGKSVRELLLDNPTDPNWGMDGVASWYTGVDIQSRVSMSSAIPDNVLQAVPHISNSWNILSSAAEYALNQDTASLNNLMLKGTPRSVQLQWEAKKMTDENGVVRDAKGNRKVEQARTPEETTRRAMLGLRPLRERLQDETLWTAKQRELADQKKLKDVATRAKMAIVNGDDVRPFLKQYQELGGNPTTILNGAQKALEEAQKTPKTRAQGDPNVGTPEAIKRYNNYDY